jgi:oligopeptide transport system permease protein
MGRYVVKRLLQAIPVLLVIATLTFFMVRLAPGGPFDEEKKVPKEIKERIEKHYGLDQPLWKQYLSYMGNLVQGDLGPSFKYAGWTVAELIGSSAPVSLMLGLLAMLIALSIGLPAGLIAALYKNSPVDYFAMSGAMIGICLPTFVMGPLLILGFSSGMGWFAPLGWYTWSDMVLPSLTLGLYYAAYVARLTRGGMLEVLSQDFIRTARAKGASERRVMLKHALKGGLLPVVAFIGPAFAGIISGSFIIETIFFIPGLGRFFVTSALNRDYTMVLGTVLFYALLIIVMNIIVDLVQAWLNPRTRLE